jgi:hypothetical protein
MLTGGQKTSSAKLLKNACQLMFRDIKWFLLGSRKPLTKPSIKRFSGRYPFISPSHPLPCLVEGSGLTILALCAFPPSLLTTIHSRPQLLPRLTNTLLHSTHHTLPPTTLCSPDSSPHHHHHPSGRPELPEHSYDHDDHYKVNTGPLVLGRTLITSPATVFQHLLPVIYCPTFEALSTSTDSHYIAP